ncbi:MAG: RdgB/HAM1 family non-canonical purine NTP pyrophosphatase [Bacteroidota bacterium]
MKICFASHNENKVKEMNAIMPKSIQLLGLKDIGIEEDIEETGDTLEENSKIKAAYVFEKAKMPVFADDSGLLVKALNDEPGVFSARYAGPQRNDDDNINLLLKTLGDNENRSASFETVITYIDQSGELKQFKGEIIGDITKEKRGTYGFGYDPIFQPTGYELTFAELTEKEKNRISHRSVAVQKLLDYLQKIHG